MNEPDLVPDVTPAGRLEASREQLRLAMRRGAGLDRPGGAGDGAASAGLIDQWLSTVRNIPGVDAIVGGVRSWWANHPLRSAAHLAGDAARTLAAPLARKQPLAMMLGALLAGAVLARLRPWRWLPRTLMFAGLLPQLASRLVAAVPLESWLDAFTNTSRGTAAKR